MILKIIYIKEYKETSNIKKRILLNIKKILNIIKIKNNTYYLPIFKDTKLSKYRIKKITNKINRLLEKDGANSIAISEYLYSNQLFKNYLYSNNINILNGRYLFKCLTYQIIEYILKTKNKEMEFRRSFFFN